MNLGKLLQACALAAPLLVASNAHALIIDDVDDDFVVNWTQLQGTNQLSATALFDVIAVNPGTVDITVSILNTSVLTTFTDAGIASIGLQTIPQVVGSYLAVGGVFEGIDNSSIPSQNNINLCVFASNNCQGGGQNELLAVGDDDVFTIRLSGTFPNGLEIVDSGIKFQTSGGSFEFPGIIVPCVSPTQPGCLAPRPQVPEPSSLLLVGLGLLGFALRRRFR